MDRLSASNKLAREIMINRENISRNSSMITVSSKPVSPHYETESDGLRLILSPLDVYRELRILRITTLLVCLLVEGGWALLPRTFLLGLAAALTLLLVHLRGGIDRRLLPLFIIPTLIFIFSIFRPGFDVISACARFTNFCVAIFLLNTYLTPQQICIVPGSTPLERDLSILLKLMAYQAIATFILGYAIPGIFMSIEVGSYTYQSALFLLNYHMMALDTTIRPDGFFFERGVFQLYLNIYLYLSLFRNRNLRNAFLALLAIATTWSTTGILLAFLLLLLFVLAEMRQSSKVGISALLSILLVIAPSTAWLMAGNIESKFWGDERDSFLVRQSDLNIGINIIREHPVFGLGFDDDIIVVNMNSYLVEDGELQLVNMADRTTSNGIIRMFIAIGIPLSLLHLWGLSRQTVLPGNLAIFSLVFFTLLSESIPFNPFLLAIMFSGILATKSMIEGRRT